MPLDGTLRQKFADQLLRDRLYLERLLKIYVVRLGVSFFCHIKEGAYILNFRIQNSELLFAIAAKTKIHFTFPPQIVH